MMYEEVVDIAQMVLIVSVVAHNEKKSRCNLSKVWLHFV